MLFFLPETHVCTGTRASMTITFARVVQECLAMAFIEEVNEPEPRPSLEVTFHSVAAEEAPGLSSKPTPKPETPNNQTKELVSAIKKLGKMKADEGKLHEPEPFSAKDMKKVKAFIFQCQLYF